MAKTAIIPCRLLESTRQTIDQYVEALQAVAAEIGDLSFLSALYNMFNGTVDDVVEVRIESRMSGSDLERKTIYSRAGSTFAESNWTKLRRSR